MKKTRFTETQIVSALKLREGGIPSKERCREPGIAEATFYNWKSRYGGMEASDLKRIKELEEENARLKGMGQKTRKSVFGISGHGSQCRMDTLSDLIVFTGKRYGCLYVL